MSESDMDDEYKIGSTKSIRFEGKDAPELGMLLNGFGFFVGDAYNEATGKVAGVLTPVSPLGEYQFTFLMSKEMMQQVIHALEQTLPKITYTSDEVIEDMHATMAENAEEFGITKQ